MRFHSINRTQYYDKKNEREKARRFLENPLDVEGNVGGKSKVV
jgi:hypothetical protein